MLCSWKTCCSPRQAQQAKKKKGNLAARERQRNPCKVETQGRDHGTGLEMGGRLHPAASRVDKHVERCYSPSASSGGHRAAPGDCNSPSRVCFTLQNQRRRLVKCFLLPGAQEEEQVCLLPERCQQIAGVERSRLDLAGGTSKTSSYPRTPRHRQSSPADPLEWQRGLISMEMGRIQVCDPLQVVAWLLTVPDEPDYLSTSVLHPFWQPPWSRVVWMPGQGSGTASALRASSLRGREGQKQSPR